MAVSRDGDVFTWGWNDKGQCGVRAYQLVSVRAIAHVLGPSASMGKVSLLVRLVCARIEIYAT